MRYMACAFFLLAPRITSRFVRSVEKKNRKRVATRKTPRQGVEFYVSQSVKIIAREVGR